MAAEDITVSGGPRAAAAAFGVGTHTCSDWCRAKAEPARNSVELLSENPAALARYPVGTEYDWEDEVTPASDVGDAEGAGSDFDLDFAFAPPVSAAKLVPADDIFAHGRIVPAYPVFDRNFLDLSPGDVAEPASTAAPSTDTYCAWTPRSAPSSPSLDIAARSTRGNCNSETTAKGVPAASTVLIF
ncbi:hypothetical protein OsJ_12220 [Oryza sativa Japonica Group]|uniref:Uncharacterized protein n=1 Tax=Oryza sativa subsp. japonica TaxID=39947 RepID=A3ALQ9_ORYSJ|nr:hypothetical protein OsJ_12220 [Oryza sativa Japonica Group]